MSAQTPFDDQGRDDERKHRFVALGQVSEQLQFACRDVKAVFPLQTESRVCALASQVGTVA